MIENTVTVHSHDVPDRVFPLLRERVFHVTSPTRLQRIREDGFIRANADGALGNTYPQSQISLARRQDFVWLVRSFVCLFDLRNKTDEAVDFGLRCFWPAWEGIAFLFVALAAHPQLLLWDDVRSQVEIGAFHIPDVECWFPRDLPWSSIDETLVVQIERGPLPHELLTS